MPDVSKAEWEARLSQPRWKNRLRRLYSSWRGNTNIEVREDWIKYQLKNIPSGSRLLDAGAGEQQYKKYCTHLDYVSQDFAQYDGTGNGVGLQAGNWDVSELDIVSDITSIPEPNDSFDAIVCIEVLEHVPEPVNALTEFHRLLRPGSTLILTAPFASLTHFAPYHFYSGFNLYFFKSHLEKIGFAVSEITANGNYFEFLIQELVRVRTVAKEYSGGSKLNVIEYLALFILLRALKRFSRKDTGSNEMLCYGYMVKAFKVK